MRAICRPVNSTQGRLGDPAFDRRLVAEGRKKLRRLRELSPPKTDESRLNAAFRHWSSAIDHLPRLAKAEEHRDRAGEAKAFKDAAAEVRAIAQLIPNYPAGECLGEGIG